LEGQIFARSLQSQGNKQLGKASIPRARFEPAVTKFQWYKIKREVW